MRQSDSIEHFGIVTKVCGDVVSIELQKNLSCQSCQIKTSCSIHGDDKKIVQVTSPEKTFVLGEQVRVSLEKAQAQKALILGYIIPFCVLFAAVITTTAVTDNELLSGLTAICLLTPYYFILYILRNKVSKKFKIILKKINHD